MRGTLPSSNEHADQSEREQHRSDGQDADESVRRVLLQGRKKLLGDIAKPDDRADDC
ncbi:MAG: hypothetical protein KJ749_08445 [Planctomycetes bacterium]|nr:hypothetical protein [Planctomycetota bacterium]